MSKVDGIYMFWGGVVGFMLFCNRWGFVNGFNFLVIKCLFYFISLIINILWFMFVDFFNG